MNKESVTLTFDESVKRDILDYFDKDINNEGIIVEKSDNTQEVLTFEGTKASLEEFGGIKKGSEVFINNDIISLMRLSKQKWVGLIN